MRIVPLLSACTALTHEALRADVLRLFDNFHFCVFYAGLRPRGQSYSLSHQHTGVKPSVTWGPGRRRDEAEKRLQN